MVETDIIKISEVIYQVDQLINIHICSIDKFMSNSDVKRNCTYYQENKSKKVAEGFNIFKIISDIYYRENFHSDILTSLLQKEQKHNGEDKYLKEFVKLLERVPKSNEFKSEINITHFSNSVVEKEISNGESRIDILIRDDTSKKAIIIENKINNAVDMKRQLPRYKEFVESKYGCDVIAIVYLSLDGIKSPFIDDEWNPPDEIIINELLVKLAAYNETENDLFNGWLKSCINITNDIDAICILRQYSKLIQNLGGNFMNNKLLADFYNKVIKENQNYETALSIKNLIDELPQYLAQRIVDKFSNDYFPFNKIWNYNAETAFGGGRINGNIFTIRIHCNIDKYTFSFYDESWAENHLKFTEIIIKHIGSDEFNKNESEDQFDKVFKFPDDENQLYEFIKKFKEKLKTLPKDIFE